MVELACPKRPSSRPAWIDRGQPVFVSCPLAVNQNIHLSFDDTVDTAYSVAFNYSTLHFSLPNLALTHGHGVIKDKCWSTCLAHAFHTLDKGRLTVP